MTFNEDIRESVKSAQVAQAIFSKRRPSQLAEQANQQ